MRTMRALIVILLSLSMIGCSMPTSAIQGSLYSFTKKEKRAKSMSIGRKSVTIKDFRENDAYVEDMDGLKEDVEEYISQHPDLSESAKTNLREIKVAQGATRDEVSLLLGKPDKVIRASRGNKYDATEIWIYKINKIRAFTLFIFPVFFVHEGYYLYFKDGALVEIERHSLKQTVHQGQGAGVPKSGS